LSKNELRNFDEIIHLPVLTSVNVDENKIKDVRFLKENKEALAYLTEMYCNRNEIRDLTELPQARLLTASF